jgi:DNA-binding NtrC family response regulator
MVFMNLKAMRVLLIGRDPADARAVRAALADAQDGSFTIECATRLSEGLERLSENGIAAVLLDMCLPDSQGIAIFEHRAIFQTARVENCESRNIY